MVVAIAAIFATTMLAHYAADPGQLWQDLGHDRNGHFNYGLNLALALRNFDLVEFFNQLQAARVWPPVHGLVLAFVMLIGGIDLRLAIVPSLIGWLCTIVLTFLIARRLFADRLTGNVAGTIAVTFALASPAFRLITADVMLEGLGAALTALCLYAYIRVCTQIDHARWWGILAVALTFLFFEKYNYWILTAIPLGIAYLSEDVTGWFTWIREHLAKVNIRTTARSAARDPYLVAATVLFCVVIALYAHGPAAINAFGQRVSLYPPENLVTIIWWVLFTRATLLWRKYREPFDATIGTAGGRLFYWLLLPIAVSFLIPKRLSAFLWYVGPPPYAGGTYNPLRALASQWEAFSYGFHVAPWAAVLVVALATVAAVRIGRLAPAGRAVLFLAALSAVAVVVHHQQQWRFQTSWLFSVWILAGAGGAIVLSYITSRLKTITRVTVMAAVVAGIALSESRQAWTPIAYAAAIHPRLGPSDLDLSKAYLPYVRGLKKVGFITTFPRSVFFAWTLHEDCRCQARVEMPWLVPLQSRKQYRQVAADWLRYTQAERVVVIDAPSLFSLPTLGFTYERLSGQIDAIAHDGRFERIATEPVPTLGATITIWRRRPRVDYNTKRPHSALAIGRLHRSQPCDSSTRPKASISLSARLIQNAGQAIFRF